ncbi:rRNA-processing protein UTP23 homolog [Zootermopsis nevadensis]|uniref:rRNA-processing protein UTP23 homolog n=1 Tax=Zootermopsis nevadensis TaxID=136037 RepID=A0A067RPN8_ZOONE|nr:rRNA-processing protein UTP23 homolog [Zootermopsis nevadensis]KDR22590.1 RRNA-processing protein UTP23-like protein [Zootermopsis nevadensis]
MKISRQKKVHRYLSFFSNNYGFRKPYQILIDGTFCYAALKNKFNIKEQTPKYLDGDVKLLTTQCVIHETSTLGHSVYGAMVIVKQFATHRCSHNDKPVPGSICLESMLGVNNPNRYIVATQDKELQATARKIPGTPLLYLHQKAPTLEQPSAASSRMARINSNEKFEVNKFDKDTLTDLKHKKFGVPEPQAEMQKRKKKRGPNPLSCKKKKKKPAKENETQTSNMKKRKRIRVPKHVKEHWVSLVKEELANN